MTNCGCLELSRVDDQKGITQHTRYYRIPTPREFSPSNHIAIILESLLERRRCFLHVEDLNEMVHSAHYVSVLE
jgi:hypothetical protein